MKIGVQAVILNTYIWEVIGGKKNNNNNNNKI